MTDEELFAEFVNDYHSDEAYDIEHDPLLYIHYRDSSDFASYKLKYYCNALFVDLCKLFRIDKFCDWLKNFIDKGEEE